MGHSDKVARGVDGPPDEPQPEDYKRELRLLQVELVKLQRHLIKFDHRVLILIEGRDASGKDGVIKRIVEHLSPRETRVVALGTPSDRDRQSWYFQRYTQHLPSAREMVLMNRSWYNRAGVERVMGFCSEQEYEEFMRSVIEFERLLVQSGIQLFKYYLDISRKEQRRRLREREEDPLKQWKTSPIDQVALKHWDDYSQARDEMLRRTHHAEAPWTIVAANDKKAARLNLIRHLMSHVECPDRDEHLANPDPQVAFAFDPGIIAQRRLAR
ncbi:MAG TPA: polyphosphate kinase 2 [Caulobacterales bacterium]|nr:polyphosphate kinase 2 [Caulobacterales bacterium]